MPHKPVVKQPQPWRLANILCIARSLRTIIDHRPLRTSEGYSLIANGDLSRSKRLLKLGPHGSLDAHACLVRRGVAACGRSS